MAKSVNIFIALDAVAQTAIKTAVKHDPEVDGKYTGPVDADTIKMFSRMVSHGSRELLWKKVSSGGKTWSLWSLYYSDRSPVLQRVANQLSLLTTKYPNRFVVVGAWWWDGRQVGTQWETKTVEVSPELTQIQIDLKHSNAVALGAPQSALAILSSIQPRVAVTEEQLTGKTVGTPKYPVHARLKNFAQGTHATTKEALASMNLMYGQTARRL